jgi:DNA-binding GntR family transcriptional regulator
MNYLFRTVELAARSVAPHDAVISALRRADGEAARAAIQNDIGDAAPSIIESLPE